MIEFEFIKSIQLLVVTLYNLREVYKQHSENNSIFIPIFNYVYE